MNRILFQAITISFFSFSCVSKPINESCEQVTSKMFNKKSTQLQTNVTWENYYENKNIIWEVKVIDVKPSRAPFYSVFYEDKYFGSGYIINMKCNNNNISGYYPEFFSLAKSSMLKIKSDEIYQISGTLKEFSNDSFLNIINADITKITKVR